MGADPIRIAYEDVEGGGGGGGIQFDTDPQAGDWLLVTTTSGNPIAHSESFMLDNYGIALESTNPIADGVGGGIILYDHSGGNSYGITIRSEGDTPGIRVDDQSTSGGISITSHTSVSLRAAAGGP